MMGFIHTMKMNTPRPLPVSVSARLLNWLYQSLRLCVGVFEKERESNILLRAR